MKESFDKTFVVEERLNSEKEFEKERIMDKDRDKYIKNTMRMRRNKKLVLIKMPHFALTQSSTFFGFITVRIESTESILMGAETICYYF